jgi:alkylated DNA repair protein alkB family protein 1
MLLDPTSREFKHARRHHYKTTKNRDGDTDTDWTPFRAAEKKYKARFPPPDLSGALDLTLLDTRRHADIERTGWKGHPDVVRVKEIDLDIAQQNLGMMGPRRAFAVVDVPGG